mgnify:CR=1 FL=1
MKIAELFGKGKTVFSCEVFPPKKTSPVDSIYKTLDGLKDIRPDFISVTYGAGGSSAVNQSTQEIASIIQNQYHITAMAHLTCVACTRGEAAELLAGPAETNPMQTFSALAGQSDYLAQAARSAKELAVLGLAAVLLFVSAVILWQLAGHIKRPDRNRKQSAFPEKEQASARWRYHAPTCPKKTTD